METWAELRASLALRRVSAEQGRAAAAMARMAVQVVNVMAAGSAMKVMLQVG